MKWVEKKIGIYLLSLTLVLSGCASLNPLDVLSPSKGVEVNAAVGKEVQTEKNNIKLEQGNTSQKADKISNDTSYKADVVNQIANELTWWQLVAIIVLAGVALPSWKELGVGCKAVVVESYKGLRFVITDICSLIVVPIKGLGDWILQILGKKQL